MDILYLSHCVPNPPDKGEKIRAFHELNYLTARYRVHLACFARSHKELEQAHALEDRCASVYAELLSGTIDLARAAMRFAVGGCLTTSFYRSRRMKRHTKSLCRCGLCATVAYSSAMAQYAPEGVPLLLDMVDVDSEKWLQYGETRRPGFLYEAEGRRLREQELHFAARAKCTVLSTRREMELFQRIAPEAPSEYLENGVDFEYFDPALCSRNASLEERQFVVFTGAMDYYPNADAVRWFAARVFPEARRRNPALEFFIVGRNPASSVARLGRLKGITVTGGVADIRPYLAGARAVVAPLRIARGIQNKVLEALAMGKRVLASPTACDTFSSNPPAGIVRCDSPEEYIAAIAAACGDERRWQPEIRLQAKERFRWKASMERFAAELNAMLVRPLASPSLVLSQ